MKIIITPSYCYYVILNYVSMDISNNTDSSTSFNLLESEEPNNLININQKIINGSEKNTEDNKSESSSNKKNTKDNKKFNRQELLKRKAYYKILLSDYKKFIKKINYSSTNTETSYDLSAITKKSIDKTKVFNIKGTQISLYNNIKKIKKNLYFINENFNEKILILDGENILKSFKYQELIKKHITQEEYDYYFSYWYKGSNNGFIQPMTSLNLLITDKIYLIEHLVKNYLNKFNCIVMVSGKSNTDLNIEASYINQQKSIVIPVIYNKEDIREQDDHLLLYIYYHLSKIKSCEIISGDKFKWFNHNEDYLKNFILEYNFNEQQININISNAYTNDIIIYKNCKYQVGYFYFPFIKNISSYKKLCINDIVLDELISNDYKKTLDLINGKNYDDINILIINIFLNLIELNSNYEDNQLLIKKYSDYIIGFVSKIIYFNKSKFDNIIFIFGRISSMSKKIFDKIEKYHPKTLYKVIFESDNDLSSISMDHLFLDNYSSDNKPNNIDIGDKAQYISFKICIEDYIFITEIYLILKSMTFLLNSKSTIKIAKLFSYIMKIYDVIEDSIHKIRKISSNSNDFNKIFLSILSHHIFMKKNGFCKKDY